jgi:hypothetical protein
LWGDLMLGKILNGSPPKAPLIRSIRINPKQRP